MQQPVWKRLMWLAIIWGGSVLALACVSMLFKMLMTQPDLNRTNSLTGCAAARSLPALSDKPH